MTDIDAATLNQQLLQDPQYVALLQQLHAPGGSVGAKGVQNTQAIWAYLRDTYGVDVPTGRGPGGEAQTLSPQGWKINAQGQLVRDHDDRDALLGVAGLMGGGYAASHLPGVGLDPTPGKGGFGGPLRPPYGASTPTNPTGQGPSSDDVPGGPNVPNPGGGNSRSLPNGTDWTSVISMLGGGLLQGLGAAFGEQQRQSFSGTEADPIKALSGVQRRISQAGDVLGARAERKPDFSHLQPGSLPTFAGGGLPMPIGVRRAGQDVPQPVGPDDLEEVQQALSLLGGRR